MKTEIKKNHDELFLKTVDMMKQSFVLLINDVISHVNPMFTTNFGYTSEEVLGKTFESFVCLEKRQEWLDFLCSAKDDVLLQKDITCKAKGNILHLSVKIQKHQEKILLTMDDIGKYREMEAGLQQYVQAFDHSRDAIFFMRDTKFVACNKTALTIFGCVSRENIIGKSLYDFAPQNQPDGSLSKDKALEYIDLALKEGSLTSEYVHQKFDDTPFDTEVKLLVLNVGRDTQTLLVIVHDITNRKNLQKGVQINAKKYETVLNNAPVGIFGFNKEGVIKEFNTQFISIIGSSKEALLGFNLFERLQDQDLLSKIQHILQKGGVATYEGEYQSVTADKKTWVRIALQAVDQEGTGLAGIGIVENITQHKNIERELLLAKEKAEEGDRLKSAFLANMSHEIRTPMNAIVGFTPLIQNQYDMIHTQIKELSDNGIMIAQTGGNLILKDLFEQIKDCTISPIIDDNHKKFDMVQHSSDLLLMLINDIIDLSKIEANQVKMQEKSIKLHDILERVYNTFHRSIDNKFEFRFIPPQNNISFWSDEFRIIQILTNLVKNAFKFTEQGFVEMGCTQKDDYLIFYVKDTGIGIAKDKQYSVFERFRQIDSSISRHHEGTGLGLAICQGLVTLLEGKLWVESEGIGKGSNFYFRIPYIIPPCEDRIKINSDFDIVLQKKDHYDWSTKRILVAEDDKVNQILLRDILKSTNIHINWAIDGKEAIDLFDKNKSNIDLILLDIKMPVMDGHEVLEYIRKLGSNVPIIMQTAYAMYDDREKSISLGANDYITKPLNKELLLNKMLRFLDSR